MQKSNRKSFREMLQAAIKRLQNRSGEELLQKAGLFFMATGMCEIMVFMKRLKFNFLNSILTQT